LVEAAGDLRVCAARPLPNGCVVAVMLLPD
jgi:hypothetical protein